MAEQYEDSRPGVLITLEGVDGCGKSTQAELLEVALNDLGLKCMRLREPGGTVISERVRDILLDPELGTMAPEAELLLFEAARAQLVREVIEPAIHGGYVVICDRFYDSSLAYQSAARGLDEGLVRRANEVGSCGMRPSRTVIVDLDPREAYARAIESGADRMEADGMRFQQLVRAGYARIAEAESDRVRVIDGRGTVAEVFGRLVIALSDVISELSTLNAHAFVSVQNDVERAFAEVEAAAAGAAERARAEEEARRAAEAEALAEAERLAAEAAKEEERMAAEEAARQKTAEEDRQKAAEQAARDEARRAAETEEAQRRAAAEEAARAEAARAEEAARARAQAAADAVAAEEAALFAQVEAAVAAEAERLSRLDPTTFAREERVAERDAMASLDVIGPYGTTI